MGKSLTNFLHGRDKFSPKKKRQPIHPSRPNNMSCPLHDLMRKRPCMGAGCRTYDLKATLKEGTPAPLITSFALSPPP